MRARARFGVGTWKSCMCEGLRMERGIEEPADGEERPTLKNRGLGNPREKAVNSE
jgi:hypothetical protein